RYTHARYSRIQDAGAGNEERRRRGGSRFQGSQFREISARPPGVHHVFIGYDRTAEVHDAQRWRDTAAAPQGADTPHLSQARRLRLLLHDLWVDDVELATQLPRGRRLNRSSRW